MTDILRYAFYALIALALLGAVALQTRSNRRGLRILGRLLTLVPFGVSTLLFVAGLVSAFQNVPGSWADLVLVILMIPFFLLAFPALYPLASILLRPRVAWTVPAGVELVSAVVAYFAFRTVGQSGTRDPLALLAVLGILVLAALLTWTAAFFRNPRCAARPDRTPSPS